MRYITGGMVGLIAMFGLTAVALGQTASTDRSARLASVLPADVAQRVMSAVARARAEQLPAAALENRALKFAARGVPPQDIARSVDEQLARMRSMRSVLGAARRQAPTGDEIEAGAEAIREGVDGATISKLAQSAPSGRSLTVPLYVIGNLVSRGVPSDEALQGVEKRLEAHGSDAEIEADGVAIAAARRSAEHGRDFGTTNRQGNSGNEEGGIDHHAGPPAGVPANAGHRGESGTRPGQGQKPSTTGHGRP